MTKNLTNEFRTIEELRTAAKEIKINLFPDEFIRSVIGINNSSEPEVEKIMLHLASVLHAERLGKLELSDFEMHTGRQKFVADCLEEQLKRTLGVVLQDKNGVLEAVNHEEQRVLDKMNELIL